MRRKAQLIIVGVFMVFPFMQSHAWAASIVMTNPSAELGTTNKATGWTTGSWGNLKSAYTVPNGGSKDGSRSLKVQVSNYVSGDAKWLPAAVAVTPGVQYSASHWYKSNVATEIDVVFELSDGSMKYAWLSNAPVSSAWKQINTSFTAPANAKRARVFQVIARNGWVQTDFYSLNSVDIAPPTPPPTPPPAPTGPFSRPLVSIEFDDGWTSAYQYGLPAVESFGWKPTQYIITETPGWQDYMTNAQIADWNNRGDIGSHTVSHPSLPSLSTSAATNEMTDSKSYLDALLGEQTKLFVTPFCESSTTVVSIAKSLYQSLRNCEPDVNTKANFDAYNLNSFIVLNTTSDSELQALLDKAKATNGWLIIVWHEIAGDNKNPWSVSAQTLQRQLQIVKNSGVTVVPTQQALNESLGQY